MGVRFTFMYGTYLCVISVKANHILKILIQSNFNIYYLLSSPHSCCYCCSRECQQCEICWKGACLDGLKESQVIYYFNFSNIIKTWYIQGKIYSHNPFKFLCRPVLANRRLKATSWTHIWVGGTIYHFTGGLGNKESASCGLIWSGELGLVNCKHFFLQK